MTSTSRADPAERFADADLSHDRFLDGKLTISQPRCGYRAGVDPVFLAAAVDARPGQSVLDLGCGAGTAALCLARRVAGLELVGAEAQSVYADLARANGERNGIALMVYTCDILDLPSELRERSFDHVIANPPYYSRRDGTRSDDVGRDVALAGSVPLANWLDAAVRRLRPGGRLTMIQRADRMADLLAGLDDRTGDTVITPLAPRAERDASRILVTARKGARGPLRLAAPVILHSGARHERDEECYSPAARAVLRDGAAWPWLTD